MIILQIVFGKFFIFTQIHINFINLVIESVYLTVFGQAHVLGLSLAHVLFHTLLSVLWLDLNPGATFLACYPLYVVVNGKDRFHENYKSCV